MGLLLRAVIRIGVAFCCLFCAIALSSCDEAEQSEPVEEAVVSERDEGEIPSAEVQPLAVLRDVTQDNPITPPPSNLYACEDGTVFLVLEAADKTKITIEFPGREPVVLPVAKARNGVEEYRAPRQALLRKGTEAKWIVGKKAPLTCNRAREAAPLALPPGNYPVFSPAAVTENAWPQNLDAYLPAIDVCLQQPSGFWPRVVHVGQTEQGWIGVRLVNADGGRIDCAVSPDSLLVESYERVAVTADTLPDEGTYIFTRADSAYPGGACFQHQKVLKNAAFYGWLSQNGCP